MNSNTAFTMLNEIKEEPQIFAAIMQDHKAYTQPFVDLYSAHNFKRIFILGQGSPAIIGQILKLAAIKLLKVEGVTGFASMFNQHEGFDPAGILRPEEMLLICPGESGHTKGPVDSARMARRLGIPVVSTTFQPKGVLARFSDLVIVKPSGEEEAVASTKGHSTGLLLLLLCLIEAAFATGKIGNEEYEGLISAFKLLPQMVAENIRRTLDWFGAQQMRIMAAPVYRFVGYGANYATAVEASLKFSESHQRPSIAYELEEFLHGPIRSLHQDDLIFFLAAEEGPEKKRLVELYHAQKAYKSQCILVHREEDLFGEADALLIQSPEQAFANTLAFLVPFQVLAYQISHTLGIDMTISTTLPVTDILVPGYTDETKFPEEE